MADNPFAPPSTRPNENDPIIRKVPMNNMGIGANSASMPKTLESNGAGIQHVSNQNRR